MNIFALRPDPAIAASVHCDQHLHKMIVESAQMLSTMVHVTDIGDAILKRVIYKPTHTNHPCTKWVCEAQKNAGWLISLCHELQNIRDSIGCGYHTSMFTVRAIQEYINPVNYIEPTNFVFAGPPEIALRIDLNVHQKYQALYKLKQKQWKGTRNQMTYKNRPWPEWLEQP
jgi:hypothetical protein